jgi:hypothetical protein
LPPFLALSLLQVSEDISTSNPLNTNSVFNSRTNTWRIKGYGQSS